MQRHWDASTITHDRKSSWETLRNSLFFFGVNSRRLVERGKIPLYETALLFILYTSSSFFLYFFALVFYLKKKFSPVCLAMLSIAGVESHLTESCFSRRTYRRRKKKKESHGERVEPQSIRVSPPPPLAFGCTVSLSIDATGIALVFNVQTFRFRHTSIFCFVFVFPPFRMVGKRIE